MSLHVYASRCELFESQLLSTLSETDVDALRKDVAEMGLPHGTAGILGTWVQSLHFFRRHRLSGNKEGMERPRF